MSKLVAYGWNPGTGVATLEYDDGSRIVRAEPTNPSHVGWADDKHAMIVRRIRVGERVSVRLHDEVHAYYV